MKLAACKAQRWRSSRTQKRIKPINPLSAALPALQAKRIGEGNHPLAKNPRKPKRLSLRNMAKRIGPSLSLNVNALFARSKSPRGICSRLRKRSI